MTAGGAAAAQATLELGAKKGERVCVMCRTGSEEGEGKRPRRTVARPPSRRRCVRHGLSDVNTRRNRRGAEQDLIICSLVEGRQETASVDLIFRYQPTIGRGCACLRRLHGPIHGRVVQTGVASLHSGMSWAVTRRSCRGPLRPSSESAGWVLSATEAQLHCELQMQRNYHI
jgi:hypothetical protein